MLGLSNPFEENINEFLPPIPNSSHPTAVSEDLGLTSLDHSEFPLNNKESATEDVPSMTLTITNVVSMANMRCHLRLKDIARSSVNVEYKALQNHVIMRLRKPYTVATIWSSGKIWCTGANSLTKARLGARRIARRIAKVGFPCRFSNYRVVNIMATCRLPFRVRLDQLVREQSSIMSYEPELAPGLNFKLDKDSSTSLKLFSTGRVVIMGSSLEKIGTLVEKLVPLAAVHQTDEPLSDDDADGDAPSSKTVSREKLSQMHPFSYIAAEVPALADVFAEEEAAALEDLLEEENDAVGTDNDSEENVSDDDDDQLRSSKWFGVDGASSTALSVQTTVAENKLQLVGQNVLSGVTKRACITAYSGANHVESSASPVDQSQLSFTGSPVSLLSLSTMQQQQTHQLVGVQLPSASQSQVIFTTHSQSQQFPVSQNFQFVSNTSQQIALSQPMQTFNNSPLSISTNNFYQTAFRNGGPLVQSGSTTPKLVAMNASGQPTIIRLVSPIQVNPNQFIQQFQNISALSTGSHHQQQQQFVFGRFPVGSVVTPAMPTDYSILSPAQTPLASAPQATIINPQFNNFVSPGYR